ncbi:MAG: hypothetical protein GY811_25735 [Myxococcales bacterium]|nr:hypothetical protein [Myxococcales bacterium]
MITICTSKVTSDCIVDTLDHWWSVNKIRLPNIDTLVLLKQAMKDVEHRLDRLSQLPAWFIDINCQPAA